MLSGNKGEWSELWVLCNLIESGVLATADSNLQTSPGNQVLVEAISLRSKTSNFTFIPFDRITPGARVGNVTERIDRDWFRKTITAFQRELLSTWGSNKELQAGNALAASLGVYTLKASSSEKVDIWLQLASPHGLAPVELGYSIKSQIGGSSTLLNAGRTSNFVYELANFDGNIEKTNCTTSNSKVRAILANALAASREIVFYECENSTFADNLDMFNQDLKEDLASMVLDYYKGNSTTISEAFWSLCADNDEHNFERALKYRLGEFLNAVALGMTPGKQWNGGLKGHGGYIVVKPDTSVVGLHLANKQEFIDYLFKSTKFDTASTTRHDFGRVYQSGNKYLIKLNLQIRFI